MRFCQPLDRVAHRARGHPPSGCALINQVRAAARAWWCKASIHQCQKITHVSRASAAGRAVHAPAANSRQMIGKTAKAGCAGLGSARSPLARHQQQTFEEKAGIPWWTGKSTVRRNCGTAVPEHQQKPMIRARVEHMLAHVAPNDRGRGCLHVRISPAPLHLFDSHVHQAGNCVVPPRSYVNPVGAI